MSAYVLLEDGTRFDGVACGADGHATGEIVFTTSMSGYQEAMTDPSYAGQLITFTYPQIGNYGVSAEAMLTSPTSAAATAANTGTRFVRSWIERLIAIETADRAFPESGLENTHRPMARRRHASR